MADDILPVVADGGKPCIDWATFSVSVRGYWLRAVDLRTSLGLAQVTTMAAYHGRPIGLLPFLRICKEMQSHPLAYLRHP